MLLALLACCCGFKLSFCDMTLAWSTSTSNFNTYLSHGTQVSLKRDQKNNKKSESMKSIMMPTDRIILPAIHSIMPTKSSQSHSFNHADREPLPLPLACCCCAHNFSFSTPSTSFTTKPPCQPTPLRSPAAWYTAASQQRSPASIATATLKQAQPLTSASDDRWLQVSYTIHDRAERAVLDEIEQQDQHRRSRCYRNWPIAEECRRLKQWPVAEECWRLK